MRSSLHAQDALNPNGCRPRPPDRRGACRIRPTTGNLGGVHAEVRIQQISPGMQMSRPFGWRTLDEAKGLEWIVDTVCAGCQQFPRCVFAPGTRGARGGPWGDQ